VADFWDFSALFGQSLQEREKAATRWVCWQSAANMSPLSNSLICGKIQGITARFALPCPAEAEFSILYQ